MSKILLITPIYKTDNREGIKKDSECVHDLVKYWTKDNEVRVIHSYVRGLTRLPYFFKKNQLEYFKNGYDFFADDIPVTIVERQNIIKNQFNGFEKDGKRICKIIKDKLNENNYEPEVIICHIPSSTRCFFDKLRINNVKKIAVLHYSDILYYNKYKSSFIKYLSDNFDVVYCRSKSIYMFFEDKQLSNLDSTIIYSGVPKINKEKVNNTNRFNSDNVNILYVGKLIKRKNLDILIKSLARIKDFNWKLTVIGTGDMLNNYKKICIENNIDNKVSFVGMLPKNEVFKYMSNSDIFCMPSIKETLGLVYIEALSYGCITIGTKDEGIDGIITDGKNGFLTLPDEQYLHDIIYKIIKSNKEKQIEISNEAIKTGNYYNEVDMSMKYLNEVKKVIKK